MTEWIAPKGWTKPELPAPPTLTPAQAKQAIAVALVQEMKGNPLPVAKAAEHVAGVVSGAGLLWSEVVAMVREIAAEWAEGKGPDVAPYVPPPPPPEPVVVYPDPDPIEPEPLPDPKEVP